MIIRFADNWFYPHYDETVTKRWSNATVAKLVDESSLYMTGKAIANTRIM